MKIKLFLYMLVTIIIITIENLTYIYLSNYTRLVVLVLWAIIFTVFIILKKEKRRYENVKDKVLYVIFILIAYNILYFSLGLIYGYHKNIYSHSFELVIKNIIYIIILGIIKEYIRYRLLIDKNKLTYIVITIIFTLLSIQFYNISYYFRTTESSIEYVFGELVPIILSSCLLTYLNIRGGLKLSITYVILANILNILLPILPNLNWFITCALTLINILAIFSTVYYFEHYKKKEYTKREIKKINPVKVIPAVLIITALTSFIAGLFPYKPVVVMSNSMKPTFSRGDIVIIKKIEAEEIYDLKEGDIIEYITESSSIVHRIYKIDDKKEGLFTTKGDNNTSIDTNKVTKEQIQGIVKNTIPYLGILTVYFNQYVLNIQPFVDTY